MNEMQLGFVFHKEKCIQCHGCEMACKTWRQTEHGVARRRVFNIWSGAYPDVTCASLSISCLHCIEPACAGVCPTGAISKRDTDGAVLVDKALCIGCRACLDACPYNVPQFGTDGLMQKCDMCLGEETNTLRIKPPCVSTCPTGALDIKTMVPQQKNDLDTEISRLYQMIQPL